MAESILVVIEQREGKLNRVSWETLTAGQALASETGWTLEAAVVGSGVTNLANEIAAKKVAKATLPDPAPGAGSSGASHRKAEFVGGDKSKN